MKYHQKVVEEFTTGEKITLSTWWCGLPKLQKTVEKDICTYVDACHHLNTEGCYMMSWKPGNTQNEVFTLAYRGQEVDALLACENGYPEHSERSRTVLFSHETGECYVTKPGIQLRHDDPPMVLVQAVVDRGDEPNIEFISLKIVDIITKNISPRDRVGMMQALGRSFQSRSNLDPRLGVMWCGDVSRHDLIGMLGIRGNLRHPMSHVVILTEDPYVQVHIPVGKVEEALSLSCSKRNKKPL